MWKTGQKKDDKEEQAGQMEWEKLESTVGKQDGVDVSNDQDSAINDKVDGSRKCRM